MDSKNKNITYLGKDFSSIKKSLEQYAKTYYPNTYNDFSESSPGNMFMEMAAYVGDLLSFYTDSQIQENFIQYASQTSNVYDIAYLLGYKPKVTSLSSVIVDFFQIVPAAFVNGEYKPDLSYTLNIEPFTELKSTTGVNFIIEEGVDFSVSTIGDPTEISIAQIDNNNPTYFLLKKSRKAVSGNINTKTFTFGEYEEFPTIEITDEKISGIIEAIDALGNKWYEVDYLGQDLISTPSINPNYGINGDDIKYLLNPLWTDRRFTSRFISPELMQIQFGSGKTSTLPNMLDGVGSEYRNNNLITSNIPLSPTSFIYSNSYGIAPVNNSITFTYITGGGISSNVASNTIKSIPDRNKVKFNNQNINPSDSLAQHILNNFYINNPNPASGGRGGDTIEEIKQNSSVNFQSQMRNVTEDDYLVRSLSMPSKYGSLSKSFARKPTYGQDKATLDIYVLSQDYDGKLKIGSKTLKDNLKRYLNQFKIIGDTVNIKDAYIINIGVNFDIITFPNYNNSKVISDCINSIKEYFDINKWKINQPILIRDIEIMLDKIEGVQTVKKVEITNISNYDNGYSIYSYDILGATKDKIIYPSLDPSIFELKYPNIDIKGKVSTI